jgi:uroporphyrinogen-III decarboxylase
MAERIDWAWQNFEAQSQRVQWLEDDTIPFLDPYTGTEIFAEAFGCPVHYPGADMPSARPLVDCARAASHLKIPSLNHPALARIFAIADELHRRAPEAVMRLPDIQSPMDIAALVWDKNDFYLALIESPDAVCELAGKMRELLVCFLDEWFSRYGRELIAHYPDYYMPSGITLSEDEVGVVSRDTFAERFLPELVSLSQRYGAIGIHCCANSQHQWEGFKAIPNLRLLNLVRPRQQTLAAYRAFDDLYATMHDWLNEDPLALIAEVPPTVRLVMTPAAKTRHEAAAISARLAEIAQGNRADQTQQRR